MDSEDRQANLRDEAAWPPREARSVRAAGRHPARRADVPDEDGNEDGTDFDTGSVEEPSRPLLSQEGRPENPGEQAEFREQFDEDLYTDREDRPAQGNTADVAMGDQRFGSEADAYSEYAWRRPGDHHSGDASAVGQARDPADIADEDERP